MGICLMWQLGILLSPASLHPSLYRSASQAHRIDRRQQVPVKITELATTQGLDLSKLEVQGTLSLSLSLRATVMRGALRKQFTLQVRFHSINDPETSALGSARLDMEAALVAAGCSEGRNEEAPF